MTHEQAVELVYSDVKKLGQPKIAEAIERSTQLNVTVRTIPGNKFRFVIADGDCWEVMYLMENLPTVLAYFKAAGVFEMMFKNKVQATMAHLEEMRIALGVEMSIAEALR